MASKLNIQEIESTTGNLKISGNVKLDMSGSNDYMHLPAGTSDQRGNPEEGAIRWNYDYDSLEVYNGTTWKILNKPKDTDDIVKAGLVVHLDSLDKNSITSNNWYDLSGNNNHFTLYNNPTVSETTNSLQLNANQSQYAKSTNTIDLTSTNAVTVEIGSKINSLVSNAMVFEHTPNWNINSGAFGFFFNSLGGYSNTPSTDNWIHTNAANSRIDFRSPSTTSMGIYSITYVSGELTEMYHNGVKITNTVTPSLKTTFTSFANDFTWLGVRGDGLNFHTQNDPNRVLDLSFYKVYDRKLTQEEITQNFNALRGRFGI